MKFQRTPPSIPIRMNKPTKRKLIKRNQLKTNSDKLKRNKNNHIKCHNNNKNNDNEANWIGRLHFMGELMDITAWLTGCVVFSLWIMYIEWKKKYAIKIVFRCLCVYVCVKWRETHTLKIVNGKLWNKYIWCVVWIYKRMLCSLDLNFDLMSDAFSYNHFIDFMRIN